MTLIEKMTARINVEISGYVCDKNLHTDNKYLKRYEAKIDGMIEMLQIVTGKQYTWGDDGLKEV